MNDLEAIFRDIECSPDMETEIRLLRRLARACHNDAKTPLDRRPGIAAITRDASRFVEASLAA
jgi:hypothetical protein